MGGSYASLGARLAEERARLRLTQQDVADACATTREAIGRYERDVNVPGGDALEAFAKLGMDVQFLITGVRSSNLNKVAEESGTYKVEKGRVGALSKDEEALVEKYRHLKPADRTRLHAIGDALAESEVKGKKKTP